MSDKQIEVYRQRYETWRHLDKLRVQMVQILIAIGTGAALTIRVSSDAPGQWFWILIGLAIVSIAVLINRISDGLRKNNSELRKAGTEVGDNGIPDSSDMNNSAMHWLTLGIGALGFLLIVKGVFFVCDTTTC